MELTTDELIRIARDGQVGRELGDAAKHELHTRILESEYQRKVQAKLGQSVEEALRAAQERISELEAEREQQFEKYDVALTNCDIAQQRAEHAEAELARLQKLLDAQEPTPIPALSEWKQWQGLVQRAEALQRENELLASKLYNQTPEQIKAWQEDTARLDFLQQNKIEILKGHPSGWYCPVTPAGAKISLIENKPTQREAIDAARQACAIPVNALTESLYEHKPAHEGGSPE